MRQRTETKHIAAGRTPIYREVEAINTLIAQEKATAWIEKRKIHSNAALAHFWRGLVHRLGLFITRGWSQLIISRWRGAASSRPNQPATLAVGLNTGVGFSSSPRRGGYHGMHVPGA